MATLIGFQRLTKFQRQQIASMGGRASQAQGVGHSYTPTEAAAAGRLGGKAHTKRHLREIGRRGGFQRAANVRAKRLGTIMLDCQTVDAAAFTGAQSNPETRS